MNLAEKIHCVSVAPGSLAICWLGQAGFLLIDDNGNQLVVDPYLTNCGQRMRGFKRLSPMLLEPEELSPDYYVVTHLHFDHFDYDAIPVVAQSNKTLFLGPSSCNAELEKVGVASERRYLIDRGDVYRDETVTVHALKADHGTMAPDAIGVVVEMGGHCVYFSGDTAFHEDLCQEVAAFKPDIAILSVNGKFGNMTAEEGAKAALLTGAKIAVPCHCWTFAEHGGNPGQFCELLKETSCEPLCFYQGEIIHFNKDLDIACRKETAS